MQQVNVKKYETLGKTAHIDKENLHFFWRNLLKFNDIFKENVTFDNIKSHQKQSTVLEKHMGREGV